MDGTGIDSVASVLGLAVIRYRDSRGLTQLAMARRAGISRGRLNAIESGRKTGVTVVTLIRLADACETTADGLLGYRLAGQVLPGVFSGLR